MFDLHHDPLKDLREFFQDRSEALQNSAARLGGQPALRCVHALMDDLAIQPRMTRSMKSNFAKLQDVLTLEHVHDVNSLEAGLFADVDPASPFVEEICLLSDELKGIIESGQP